MGAIKLKHTSGNGTILNSPAANPSSDITLKLPSTTGSAGQVLQVASANHSSTNAELEFAAAAGGKLVNYSSANETAVVSSTAAQGGYSGALISISYAAASSSNKLLIIAQVNIATTTSAAVYATLHVGGSPSSYRGDASGNRQRISTSQRSGNDGGLNNHNITTLISSPATSSTAYDVRGGHAQDASLTMYLNRTEDDVNQNYEGRCASSITILEFEP